MELETESFGEKATWLDPSEKAFDAGEPDPHYPVIANTLFVNHSSQSKANEKNWGK